MFLTRPNRVTYSFYDFFQQMLECNFDKVSDLRSLSTTGILIGGQTSSVLNEYFKVEVQPGRREQTKQF